MADAGELGRSSRLREEAERVVHETQERLLEAEASSVDFGDPPGDEREASSASEEREASSASEEHRSRSRSPRRRVKKTRAELRFSPGSGRHSPVRVDMQAKSVELPRDFVVAMQDMFFPVELHKCDRPADILRYESSLGTAVRMAPLSATTQIAYLILALRQIALDCRVDEARLKGTAPLGANVPLTREEVGIVMDSLKSEFREQELTKQQAEEDERESCTGSQKRKRMRGRWFAYQERLFGNRKLGMALITLGFEVDLKKLATVYAQTTADGDASSLPSRDLRQRTLSEGQRESTETVPEAIRELEAGRRFAAEGLVFSEHQRRGLEQEADVLHARASFERAAAGSARYREDL